MEMVFDTGERETGSFAGAVVSAGSVSAGAVPDGSLPAVWVTAGAVSSGSSDPPGAVFAQAVSRSAARSRAVRRFIFFILSMSSVFVFLSIRRRRAKKVPGKNKKTGKSRMELFPDGYKRGNQGAGFAGG